MGAGYPELPGLQRNRKGAPRPAGRDRPMPAMQRIRIGSHQPIPQHRNQASQGRRTTMDRRSGRIHQKADGDRGDTGPPYRQTHLQSAGDSEHGIPRRGAARRIGKSQRGGQGRAEHIRELGSRGPGILHGQDIPDRKRHPIHGPNRRRGGARSTGAQSRRSNKI